MRLFIISVTIIFILSSCSNQNRQGKGDTKELSIISTINRTWLDFYKKNNPDFNLNKFKLIQIRNEGNLMNGVILADFDRNFNKVHSQFLINSPDNSMYIDLDYYQKQIIKRGNEGLICEGFDVDQEVNWVNRKTKVIKRIDFCGTSCSIEDAKWVNNSNIVLFGLSESKPTIEFIDLEHLEFKLFSYPDSINCEDNFTENVRLKQVKFLK